MNAIQWPPAAEHLRRRLEHRLRNQAMAHGLTEPDVQACLTRIWKEHAVAILAGAALLDETWLRHLADGALRERREELDHGSE
jgi:hypothetical protein